MNDEMDDRLVLVRTVEGQRAALYNVGLPHASLRLLRLANGFTTLGDLIERLESAHDWNATAKALVASGLLTTTERAIPVAQ